MSEDKKKKIYYYGGKEKKASEIKKQEEILTPNTIDFQRDFDRMMDQMKREFRDFWETPPARWGHGVRKHFRTMPNNAMIPSVDLEENEKDFRLTVDLPGFSKDNVDIQVNDDSIVVNAKKTVEEEEKNKNYIHRERSAKTFYRRIPLPERIQSDSAKASLTNGMLVITLPKKEPKETKKLMIE